LACVGAEPLGLTDCLNFGSPEKPETMWRFSQSIDGIRDACNALGIPVVSGNVSLYNETDGQPILPTPTVALVGQLQAIEDRVTMPFKPGMRVALLGTLARGALGASEWLTSKVDAVTGEPVGIDLASEGALHKALIALARSRVLSSAHDVGDGGLAVALAECCIPDAVGCSVRIGIGAGRELAKLFSEEPSRAIVTFAPEHEAKVHDICRAQGVPCVVVGETGGDRLRIDDQVNTEVSKLAQAHRDALASIVGAD
jgi:phosphoribosylformylglycinamidine synthase subunit PurL